MVGKRQVPACYLCGEPATTRDHIPPKGIFPSPRPKQLITVPACVRCNSDSKLDDEYFRWLVASIGEQTASADALIKERILPRFTGSPGLLRAIMRKSTVVDVVTRSGIWIGRRPAFEYDRPRIQRIVEKVVSGLYLHEFGERLENATVDAFTLNPEDMSEEDQALVASLPLREVARGVFSYRCARDEETRSKSIWYLMFFEPNALFRTRTVPSEGVAE